MFQSSSGSRVKNFLHLAKITILSTNLKIFRKGVDYNQVIEDYICWFQIANKNLRQKRDQ